MTIGRPAQRARTLARSLVGATIRPASSIGAGADRCQRVEPMRWIADARLQKPGLRRSNALGGRTSLAGGEQNDGSQKRPTSRREGRRLVHVRFSHNDPGDPTSFGTEEVSP